MNPVLTIELENGKNIVVELLPDNAPNAVNSILSVAMRGGMDNHKIQRIVPGKWIDLSYSAFNRAENQYLIPKEYDLHPEIEPLDSHPGCACLGGYGDRGLASCEIFFPVKDCPEHKGVYPVIGKVVEGMDEIYRLEKVATKPVPFPYEGVEVNEPLTSEIITRVSVRLNGYEPQEPVKMPGDWKPRTWKA